MTIVVFFDIRKKQLLKTISQEYYYNKEMVDYSMNLFFDYLNEQENNINNSGKISKLNLDFGNWYYLVNIDNILISIMNDNNKFEEKKINNFLFKLNDIYLKLNDFEKIEEFFFKDLNNVLKNNNLDLTNSEFDKYMIEKRNEKLDNIFKFMISVICFILLIIVIIIIFYKNI